jgi:hypothetical protein
MQGIYLCTTNDKKEPSEQPTMTKSTTSILSHGVGDTKKQKYQQMPCWVVELKMNEEEYSSTEHLTIMPIYCPH